MKNIFKHMLPYKGLVIGIFLLLIVQAWCDLALPGFTSDIIDVGIQSSGVEHIVPEKIRAEEKEIASVFMTDEEAKAWDSAYVQEGDLYVRTATGDTLDELDEALSMSLIMNYQTSAMEEDAFRQLIKEQMGEAAVILDNLSLEQIGALMGVKLEPFEREVDSTSGTAGNAGGEAGNIDVSAGNGKEELENAGESKTTVTCVDVRPLLSAILDSGRVSKDDLMKMRDSAKAMTETVGTSMLHSMGVRYAIEREREAGVNLEKKQTRYLLIEGAKMLGLTLLMGIVTVIIGFLASKVGAGVGRDLRGKVFRRVVSFSSTEMDRFSTASLITRCTNDVQQIQIVSIIFLRMVAYAPILGIGGIFRVVQTGAGMTWVIALAVFVVLGYVLLLMSIARPKFQLMQKMVDRVNLISREILTGLSVIRAFGREEHEEQRFDDANRNLTKTMLFTNRVMTFMMPGMMLIMYLVSVTIVWVGAHRIDEGAMQVGVMTAFLTYALQIIISFLMMTVISIMLPRAAVAADRLEEVLTTSTSITEKDAPLKIQEKKGLLCVDHVYFKYPGGETDALEDITFTAKPGETTAIIGSTGCGKSTMVNLIPRLYDVTGGRITLDGADIRDLSLKDLRDEIGFVPQKAVLFSGTIAGNLRFGKKDASDEEIRKAARIAQAAEFIDEKTDGYESEIAQGGANVSGGQKQRLSIARALAKDAKVYVFDDSFSALDLKTDAALRRALGEQMGESTVIIVAQRISTVLHADQILVLDEGRIVGKGTHEELLKNCEVYEQIARSQLSPEELGIGRENADQVNADFRAGDINNAGKEATRHE